jgi:hypothetical protein
MLTIKECRNELKHIEKVLSDEEIKEIRDWLYMLAESAIEVINKSEKLKNVQNEKNSNNIH